MAQKQDDQQKHFIERMYQRYGFRINDHDVNVIKKAIQDGESVYVGRQSNRVTLHKIEWDGKEITIVYDTTRSQPVTVLAEHMQPWLLEVEHGD